MAQFHEAAVCLYASRTGTYDNFMGRYLMKGGDVR
jgi:hypothetical protein